MSVRYEDILKALAVAFAAVYLFSLRESTRLAAEWGAFQFKNKRLFWRKFVRWSLPILVLLPWVMYVPFSKVVAWLTTNSFAGSWGLLGYLGKATAAILLFGLFPRATKHGWSLISTWVIRKRGEISWLNARKVLEKDLPDPWYSWQVVVVLGVFPFVILLHIGFCHGFGILIPTNADFKDLSVYTYASQCIVLHQLAKIRKYFYPDSRPRCLVSKRMWLTVPVTVLLPLLFGVLWYLWILALAGEPNRYRLALGIFCLVLALPFPLYCHQSILLVAQRRGWTPDLLEESTWPYKVSAVFAVMCAIGMLYFSIRYWTQVVRV